MTTSAHHSPLLHHGALRVFALGLLLFAIAGSVASAPLWHHVTVVSVESWRFDDVTVVLAENADSLIVHHADNTKSTVAFGAIESITDALGNDITALVLDRSVEKTERIRPENKADFATRRTSRSYRFRAAFSFAAGASAVTGFRFEGVRGDIAFETAARIRLFKRAYVGAIWTRQNIANRKKISEYLTYRNSPYPFYDFVQQEFYFVIGGNSNPSRLKQALFFAELGAGAITYDYEFDLAVTVLPWDRIGRSWDFTIRLAAGMILPLDRTWGLMLGVNTRFTGDFLKEGGSTGTLIGAHLGLVYMAGT